MKKTGSLILEKTYKKTTIGHSHRSKRRHGTKNHNKKFSADYRGQGK